MTITNYDSKECSKCRVDKKLKDYYLASSNEINADNRLSICKTCLESVMDFENPRDVADKMRMIDRPFILSEYEGSLDKKYNNSFREYMRRLGMHQYRTWTWDDSDFGEGYSEQEVEYQSEYDNEVLERWRGYDEEKMQILENKYQELINAYEHDTPIQRNIYRNIAIAQMQADEAISQNKTGDFQKMMKVVSDLMNDAKIKPLQETGVDDKGLNTWGEWIKKIEETEPIPEASDEFKDVDGIRKYIDKWFVKHMKKVFGLESTTEAQSDILEDGDK